MRPLVVVVGSGDPARTYSPPLRDQERLSGACHEIGRELATAGCDLVVFSSSDGYIENDVVRGYLSATEGGTGRGRVLVRTPQPPHVDFGLTTEEMAHVHIETDTATEWEVSYYRSVHQADGLITVGGGRSTRIAGVLAIAQGTPVVTLANFGGAGAVIRDYLDKNRNHATAEDIVVMGRPWSADSAARLVASLLQQRDRRALTEATTRAAAHRRQRARTRTALSAVTSLVLAASTVLLASTELPRPATLCVLLAGPMFGAVGGALLRESTDESPDAVWSAARGLGAGMLSAMLYVASQLLTSPDLLGSGATLRLLWFVVPLGIAAGYTFDLVYARLRQAEILPPQPAASSSN
jgi:hypothetical protein